MMINQRLLMSDARHFSVESPINPYYTVDSVDISEAVQEHESLARLLGNLGIEVVRCEAPASSQDGVYTANWALIRGELAILARLPEARKTEEAHARAILESLGKRVLEAPAGYRYSGQGDALACGEYLFCGQGYRSDNRAQLFAAKKLGYTRIQLQTLPKVDSLGVPVVNKASGWEDSYYYDIDLALSIIRPPEATTKGLVAYCPAAFTRDSIATLKSLGNIELIEVSELEARDRFACNLISTGTDVVMSAGAPELHAALEAHGLTVHTPKMSELSKGGGYIRCVTLSI